MYGVLRITEHRNDIELQPDYAEPVETFPRRYAKQLVLKAAGLEVISRFNQSTDILTLLIWILHWAAHNDNRTMSSKEWCSMSLAFSGLTTAAPHGTLNGTRVHELSFDLT